MRLDETGQWKPINMVQCNKLDRSSFTMEQRGGGFETSPDLFRLPRLPDNQSGAGVQDADDVVYRVPRVRRSEHIVRGATRAPVTAGASWRTSL